MKIVFVIDVMRKGGGAQKVISILLPILQNNGFFVELIVLKKTTQLLEIPNIKRHYILCNESQSLVSNSFFILEQMTQIAKDADLICSFMDFATSYFVGLSAKILLKPYYVFVRCEPSYVVKTFSQAMINQKLYSLCLQGAQKVICNSNSSLRDIVENFGVKEEKGEVLYNPIDFRSLEILANRGQKIQRVDKEIICVSVGRLHSQKNYHILLEACRVLQEHRENIRFFIIGEGELRTELENKKKEYNLVNLEFLGYHANMYGFLKSADIFLHLSSYEGFPNAVLEAASFSKPLILSNIRPHREVFEKNALFFEVDDVEGLCECIKAMEDEKVREHFSLTARQCVESFSYERFEKEVLEEFRAFGKPS